MSYNMHGCNVMHQKRDEKKKKTDRVRQGDRYREHRRSTEGGKCELSRTETVVRGMGVVISGFVDDRCY